MTRYAPLFAQPNGPGDARPTAQQIIHDESLSHALPTLSAIVTGTSSGIGIPTVHALASTGMTVYATARNVEKAERALTAASDRLPPAGRIEVIEMDNTSLASVRRAATAILAHAHGRIHILVCNAGVMQTPYGRTRDGFETQFATNHLSHFLLFQLVKDALLAGAAATPTRPSRVVCTSSSGHAYGPVNFADYNYETTPYDAKLAYGSSKTANIYMANYIDRLYGAKGIHATSVHPGGVQSGLQEHVPQSVKDEWARTPDMRKYMSSPEQGAATQVFCAVAKQWAHEGGVYCENVGPAVPAAQARPFREFGYKPWVYDAEGEERLWRDSLVMVGLSEEMK